MSARSSAKTPSYRRYKPKNLAVVRIRGTDHYLGSYDSPESWERYHRLVADWHAGRTQESVPAAQPFGYFAINFLTEAYLAHAQAYYRRNGEVTREYGCLLFALDPLQEVFGLQDANQFGPKALKTYRQHLIQKQWSRTVINACVIERSVEHNGVLQACEELGIGFVPWGPLGQGYLPGTMTADVQSSMDPKNDLRATFPRFSPLVIKNNRPIIEVLTTFGAKKGGATPAQIALAWLMAKKPWIVPIPGTTSMDHLRENMGAVDIQLTREDLRDIETAFSRIEIYGGRMDARQMAQIGQD